MRALEGGLLLHEDGERVDGGPARLAVRASCAADTGHGRSHAVTAKTLHAFERGATGRPGAQGAVDDALALGRGRRRPRTYPVASFIRLLHGGHAAVDLGGVEGGGLR